MRALHSTKLKEMALIIKKIFNKIAIKKEDREEIKQKKEFESCLFVFSVRLSVHVRTSVRVQTDVLKVCTQ